ncbi:uncharacterized protein LOC117176323 [Belonocnema kinseyi]|uniref:uncharacterized protein LOC117176323 n=1 Tax=Belonocnema kinseyi TaxID=2817044 RepID=UPI00143D7924|nr:uncharacterized protein LOC117176323 [Belonocnema kinseyi]
MAGAGPCSCSYMQRMESWNCSGKTINIFIEHVNSGPQDLLHTNHVTHAAAVCNGLPSEPSTLLSDGHSYEPCSKSCLFKCNSRSHTTNNRNYSCFYIAIPGIANLQ